MSAALEQAGLLRTIYIVYWDAADYPGRYTCRRWVGTPSHPRLTPEERLFANCDNLPDVRRAIQADNPRAVRYARKPIDDKVIKEKWAAPGLNI